MKRMFRPDVRLAIVAAGAGWGTAATLTTFADFRAALGAGAVLLALLVLVIVTKPQIEERKPESVPTPSSYFGFPVIDSPYVPEGQVIVMNPETRQKLFKHLTAIPRPISFAEPVTTEKLDALASMFKICPHRWDGNAESSITYVNRHDNGEHECILAIGLHGRKCVCACGATAAYVERTDGTIDKTFEEGT